MTWEQLASALQDRYPHAAADSERSLRLVLVTAGEAPMRLGLRVLATTAYGEPVAVIAADLGPAHGLDPFEALIANSLLAHGALAIDGGVLVLRAVVPMSTETAQSFDARVRALAAEAAELKRQMTATRPAADSFAHLVD